MELRSLLSVLMIALMVGCGDGGNKKSAVSYREDAESEVGNLPLCYGDSLPASMIRDVDFLSFPNFGYRGVGRCRGHALLTQRLLYFFRFNSRAQKDWDCLKDPNDCRLKLQEALRSASRNEVVIINGYKNLRELSQDDYSQVIFRNEILKFPSRYSATPISLTSTLPRQRALFKDIKRRLKLNHLPYISIKGQAVGSHGVLAYKKLMKQGKSVICVRDPNIIPRSGREECLNYFYESESAIRYVRDQREDSLVRLEIFSDEEARLSSFRQSLCDSRRLGFL